MCSRGQAAPPGQHPGGSVLCQCEPLFCLVLPFPSLFSSHPLLLLFVRAPLEGPDQQVPEDPKACGWVWRHLLFFYIFGITMVIFYEQLIHFTEESRNTFLLLHILNVWVKEACSTAAVEPLEKPRWANMTKLYGTASELMSCVFHGHGCLHNTIPLFSVKEWVCFILFAEVTAHYKCWKSSSEVKQTALFKNKSNVNGTMTCYRKDPPSIPPHDIYHGKSDPAFVATLEAARR